MANARNRAHLKTKGVAPPEPHKYENHGLDPLTIGGGWLLFLMLLFLLTEGCR